MKENGSIVFTKRDNDATLKELKFNEAYMLEYKEAFNSINNQPVTESLTLSTTEISRENGTYVNEWY